MYHSLFTRCKFNECTKLFDADNFTCKDLSCFKISCNDLNHVSCLIHALLINSTDRYRTFVCDINLNTCTLNDRVDSLSSLTYNITDLLRIDLNLDDLRSIFSYRCTWSCNTFLHNFCQDIFSCFFCTSDCFFYDRSCQSMDLDIHLDCCDTVMSSGYLEVHISEEVFKSLDICENNVIIICIACYQTTGNTCYRFFDRYTGCHQRHCGCTDTCLRSRTIGFKCLRYSTDRIWEFLFAWKYRN